MLGTLNDRGLICKRPALPAVAFPSPTGRLGRNPCGPRAGRHPSTKPASVRHLAAYITEPHEATLHLRCSSGITPPRLPCLGRAPPCPSRRGGPHALLACHARRSPCTRARPAQYGRAVLRPDALWALGDGWPAGSKARPRRGRLSVAHAGTSFPCATPYAPPKR